MTDPTPAEALKAIYEARICLGIPTDCCDYGVISHATGKEVCRVWTEEDARLIADLLNTRPTPDAGEVRERPGIFERLGSTGDRLLGLSPPSPTFADAGEVRTYREGIEDAARVAEDCPVEGAHWRRDIAAAIRKLP